MKKIMTFALALAMICSLAPTVGASIDHQNAAEQIDSIIVGNQEFTREEITASIDKDDLLISDEVAYIIAEMFIRDMMVIEDVLWNDATAIVNTVSMYDETDSNTLSAYSFELTKGYVIVAAYLDAPNIILEWSDESEPVYAEIDLTVNDKVVYTGGLSYFKDNGTDQLESVSGEIINRNAVTNVLEQISSIDNISNQVLESVAQENAYKEYLDSDSEGEIVLSGIDDEVINDPYEHAEEYYGGTFYYSDHINYWQDYINNDSYNVFGGSGNPCVPVAIANMIISAESMLYGESYTNSEKITLFDDLEELGEDLGIYDSSGTISPLLFLRESLGIYLSDYNLDDVSSEYTSVRSALLNDALLFIVLAGHGYYGDHAVLGFAYTRIVRPSSEEYPYQAYKTYIKIVDGLNTGSIRFLDLAFVEENDITSVVF